MIRYHILSGACMFGHADTLKDARKAATNARYQGGSATVWAERTGLPANVRADVTITAAMRTDLDVALALDNATLRPP